VPALAATGGIDNNAMTARIMTNHRNFIVREYRMKAPIANRKRTPVEAAEPGKRQIFLKLPGLRVVELYRSNDSKTKTSNKNNGISYDKNDTSPCCGYWLSIRRLRGGSKSQRQPWEEKDASSPQDRSAFRLSIGYPVRAAIQANNEYAKA
jgi:hypothetical protein